MTSEGVGGQEHLSRVRAVLSREFADRLDDVIIDRIVTEEVAALGGARVRAFIPVLAVRRGRLRLREEARRLDDGSVDLREVNGERKLAERLQDWVKAD